MNQHTSLSLIRKGVPAWNAWRKDNPDTLPVLDGIRLSDLDLTGVDFSGLSLKDASICHCDLSYANFISATLTSASLQKSNLAHAKMIAAKMDSADLSECEITGTNMLTASVKGAQLNGLDFRGHDLGSLNLHGVSLRGANLSDQNLSKADLTKTDLSHSILQNVNFVEANLSEANLSQTQFIDCQLDGCNFRQANLESVELQHSKLSNVNFEEANLRNVNLRECVIDNSNFSKADITGAKLWKLQCQSWTLNRIKCDYAFWDEKNKEKTSYDKYDFERIYTKSIFIELRYPYRLSAMEIITMPIFIEHLEAFFWSSSVRLKSVEDIAGGARVILSVDEVGHFQPSELKDKMQDEANRIQLAQMAFRRDAKLQRNLKEELAGVKESFWPRLLELAMENEREHVRKLTIVFIDLKGFSQWQEDELSSKLSLFRGLIKPILERWQASHPNMEGDSLRVTFRNATAGLACACMMREVLSAAGFEVRAGVEIGEVTLLHNEVTEISDIEGGAVIMAARLEGAAEPGQVLVSEKVRHYIREPNRFIFTSLDAELKKNVGNKKQGERLHCYSVNIKAADFHGCTLSGSR